MSDRPSHKPRDPLVAYLVGVFAVASVFLFVWFAFAVGLWVGVRSVGSVLAYVGGVAAWLYPVALIASGVVAVRSYRAGDYGRARLVALVPFLWIVPMVLIIVVQSS